MVDQFSCQRAVKGRAENQAVITISEVLRRRRIWTGAHGSHVVRGGEIWKSMSRWQVRLYDRSRCRVKRSFQFFWKELQSVDIIGFFRCHV